MCLAICILILGAMFMYVKQKLFAMEAKIHLLSETISTMAGITMSNSKFCEPQEDEFHEDESYDESHEDESHEDESPEDESHDSHEFEELPVHELVNEIKHIELHEELPEIKTIELPDESVRTEGIVEPIKITVSDDDVNVSSVKQIVVDTSYESMTIKELKEKISELNGPKFKTKKEMLEYLKNKI